MFLYGTILINRLMFLIGTIGGDELRINLKKLREKKKITQEQLAEEVGIARTTYTNIELGIKNPSFDVAVRIKEVLEVKDDNIFLIIDVPKRNYKKTKIA